MEVALVHFVETVDVMLERIVLLVQPIAVPASQYPHIIVEIRFVIMVKHARHVQETVDHVLHHPLLHIVEMGLVTLEKIVSHVHQIALEPIHVSIALLQTGKHPLGWNVVHHVEIQQHGFQNMVKVVVVHYKISQCLLHIIMVLTFHHVHVPLLVLIVEMVHVMEPKRVELALEIVEHVHLRLEQELKHHPIHLHKHPLALEQELELHPILLHKHPLEQGPLLKHRPIPRPILLHKHQLALELLQRLEHKHPLEQGRHPILLHKHQLAQGRPPLPLQKPIHPLHLERAQPVALLPLLLLQV